MTLLNYTDFVPTPAPLTTGTTIQSYTDPTGVVWVAKNGVASGQWKRATDVMKCRVYRNAAWTPASTSTAFGFDTVTKDDYGLYNLSSLAVVVPIAGWWRFLINIAVGTPTAGVAFGNATTLSRNGTGYAQNNDLRYSIANGIVQNPLMDIIFCAVSDSLTTQFLSGMTSPTGRVGSTLTWANFEYVGSG